MKSFSARSKVFRVISYYIKTQGSKALCFFIS